MRNGRARGQAAAKRTQNRHAVYLHIPSCTSFHEYLPKEAAAGRRAWNRQGVLRAHTSMQLASITRKHNYAQLCTIMHIHTQSKHTAHTHKHTSAKAEPSMLLSNTASEDL